MPDLEHDLVHDREQWYVSRPDYILRMTERSRKYLFHIVEELERRNMPTELALLPFIESAFNPEAISAARACSFQPHMAVVTRQRQQPEATAIAHLGMWPVGEQVLDQCTGRRPDVGGPVFEAVRRPFQMRAVCRRHVLGRRRVPALGQ